MPDDQTATQTVMSIFLGLWMRGLLLVLCGGVIIGALKLASPKPLGWRPWPICLAIACAAAMCLAAIAALMMVLPR